LLDVDDDEEDDGDGGRLEVGCVIRGSLAAL
jgi:hypothetical protein